MNELLSWALVVGAILAFIGLGFAALQVTSSKDEFWIARGFFVLAATVALGRVILWGITTARSRTLRLLVCLVVGGLVIAFAIEAVRYVNRKKDGWASSRLVNSITPQLKEKPIYDTPEDNFRPRIARSMSVTPPDSSQHESTEVKPNVVCLGAEIRLARVNADGTILGGTISNPLKKQPNDCIAIVATYRNLPTRNRKIAETGQLSARLKCMFGLASGKQSMWMNRGAWLDQHEGRVTLGIGDARSLILALLNGDEKPFFYALERDYTGSLKGWETRGCALDVDKMVVHVQLLSETDGTIIKESRFILKMFNDPDFRLEMIETALDGFF